MAPLTTSVWALQRIAAALAERTGNVGPSDGRAVRNICTDTRALQPGDCFVALVGDQFDGHAFIEQAVVAGAAALVVSVPPRVGTVNIPTFVVDDTLVALGDLARYWRRMWGKPIVAVGGSNGKTTTKELIRSALSSVFDVHATQGNFNNRVGVPLTLLSIPPSADIAVVEVGTNQPGEIAMLRDIVEPDIAVVTSVAEEHLELLGDLQGVLQEEAQLFAGVPLAITPAAQPEIADAARGKAERVMLAGLDAGDLRAERWTPAADGHGTLVVEGVTVEVPLAGLHNLRNAMLALAAARECGVSLDDAARGLASVTLPPMRMAWQRLGSATLINDAYNANPASMYAALDVLSETGEGRQRVAVLGPMRELGAGASGYHEAVARAALASRADVIGVIGEMADAMDRLAPGDPRIVAAPDVDQLWAGLESRLAPDATILLKASRGVRLERLLPHLTTWASATCSTKS